MGEQVPSIGRVVHYRLDIGPHAGECRPAFVVRVWSDTLVNLQVFVDGTNDYDKPHQGTESLPLWRTSVHQNSDNEPGTWHWPEHVPAKS
jgi:hypothetical protein